MLFLDQRSFQLIGLCLLLFSCGTKTENSVAETYKNGATIPVDSNQARLTRTNVVRTDSEISGKCTGSSDPFKLKVISKINEAESRAISVASEALLVDDAIPEKKRNLENYDVELRQDKNCFYVYFSAHSSNENNERLSEGGETSLGKSTMFFITKNELIIEKRYFFK